MTNKLLARLLALVLCLFVSCATQRLALANSADDSDGYRISPDAVNTGFDNGYKEDNRIGGKDPHFSWELGYFTVTGYSGVEEAGKKGADNDWRILKNTGDEITLWFHLDQDIDSLNDNERLSIAEDTNGYDERFGVKKKKGGFGRGTLIIKYTDSKNKKKEPTIYTNYLSAKAKKGADTKVKVFEEGDYEVALDYEVFEDKPVEVFEHTLQIPIETPVTSSRNNYRIAFKFSIRDADSKAFVRDVKTGSELENSSYTENGFYLDTANSKYLTFNLKRDVITYGVDGIALETKENRRVEPDKDREYTEEGIYTITATNRETKNSIPTTIYVGTDSLLKTAAETGRSVEEIVEQQNVEHEVEDEVYSELVESLSKQGLYIEDVEVTYLSKEYLQKLEYNSRENIYFGYTPSEINKLMGDKKYAFTLGKNDKTEIIEIEDDDEYPNIYGRAIENVAVGGGVIIVCASASVVATTVGAPTAVAVVLASAAEGGVAVGVSSAAIGGTIAGLMTLTNSGDPAEAFDSAVLQASEEFKWGAITGAVMGGASKLVELKGLARNGLTLSEAAEIQKETGLPNAIIKNLASKQEAKIYQDAGLEAQRLATGEWAYLRKIDLDTPIDGVTNMERILNGKAPIDPVSGKYYELHHIGQNPESPLAILTKAEHMQGGNNKILHPKNVSDVEHGAAWAKQRIEFWKDYLNTAKELGWI